MCGMVNGCVVKDDCRAIESCVILRMKWCGVVYGVTLWIGVIWVRYYKL